MNSIMRPSLALLAALVLFSVPGAGAALATAWDQAAVTALAMQLADAAGDVRQSVRMAPSARPAGSRNRARALDDLRVVENSINHLARQLEQGKGAEDTYPTFQRIQTLRRDIAMRARQAALTEPTISKFETARGLLEQLAPYYAAEVEAIAGAD